MKSEPSLAPQREDGVKMSVLGPVSKSLITRLLVFPITAAAALLTTSIVVKTAGGVEYGTIALISTLVQLVPFADLGLGAAVINEISATTDARRRLAVFRSAVRKLFLPMAVVVIVAPAGATFFSWAKLLGIDAESVHSVNVTTSLVIAIFGLSIPLGLGQRALVGLGKNHVSVAVAIVTSLGTLALTWTLSQTQLDSIFLAVCPAIASLAGAATAYALAQRLLRRDSADSREYKALKIRGLFRQATPMVVIMIGIPVAFQTHRILLSLRSTPFELSEYSLTMQFYFPMWSFITVAATTLWPIFSRGRSLGENQAKRLLQSLAILACLGGMFALLLAAFGNPIGSIVSNHQISIGPSVLLAAALLLFVQSIQQVPGMFLTDTSGLWFQALCIVFLAIWTLGFGWWATPLLGAMGPLLATASGVVVFQLVPGTVRVMRILRSPLRVEPSA